MLLAGRRKFKIGENRIFYWGWKNLKSRENCIVFEIGKFKVHKIVCNLIFKISVILILVNLVFIIKIKLKFDNAVYWSVEGLSRRTTHRDLLPRPLYLLGQKEYRLICTRTDPRLLFIVRIRSKRLKPFIDVKPLFKIYCIFFVMQKKVRKFNL
jgi:hypothetical protein